MLTLMQYVVAQVSMLNGEIERLKALLQACQSNLAQEQGKLAESERMRLFINDRYAQLATGTQIHVIVLMCFMF
jgi:hypothetical protein